MYVPKIVLRMSKHKKLDTDQTAFSNEYHEFKSCFPEHICIDTDGSKSEGKVASAATSKQQSQVFQTSTLFKH